MGSRVWVVKQQLDNHSSPMTILVNPDISIGTYQGRIVYSSKITTPEIHNRDPYSGTSLTFSFRWVKANKMAMIG
jgi:hypothetical protein